MQLSKNFTVDELTLSQTAARQGIDNTPPPDVLRNLGRLALILEDVRALVGRPITISSGYRSSAVNAAVGGAANSAHLSGLAADINCPGLSPAALAAIIKTSTVKYDQLILEFDRWVHIGLSENAPRFQLMTIRTGTGYMKGIV